MPNLLALIKSKSWATGEVVFHPISLVTGNGPNNKNLVSHLLQNNVESNSKEIGLKINVSLWWAQRINQINLKQGFHE